MGYNAKTPIVQNKILIGAQAKDGSWTATITKVVSYDCTMDYVVTAPSQSMLMEVLRTLFRWRDYE